MTRPAFLVSHPIFKADAFNTHHPLSGGRQRAVLDLIETLGFIAPQAISNAPLADIAVLRRFHRDHYLEALQRVSNQRMADAADRARYRLGTMECPVFDGLWERALATVGGSILASELAMASGGIAFHPGGGTHHGRPDYASGFCYLNDPVFAIDELLRRGAERVAYIDFDAHHGDGVQDALAHDKRVTFFSIHEEGRWPGTGALDDRLDGRACNMMVPRNLNDSEFEYLVGEVVLRNRPPNTAAVTAWPAARSA